MHWPGVLEGPVMPYVSFRHSHGPGATLLQWPVPPVRAPTDMRTSKPASDHSSSVPLPEVNGSILEGGGQAFR